jgi:hypothetical protein
VVTKRPKGIRRPIEPDEAPEAPEPTAMPVSRPDLTEEDDDRLVPATNVGGAVPTVLGGDSGGDLPGAEDDLTSLIEPEPPESPEVGAVHVRREQEKRARRPRR